MFLDAEHNGFKSSFRPSFYKSILSKKYADRVSNMKKILNIL